MFQLNSQAEKAQAQLPLPFFFFFYSDFQGLAGACSLGRAITLLSLPIQMLSPSRNAATDTPTNNH